MRVTTVPGLPMFSAGDALAPALIAAITAAGIELAHDDIVVVAQKIVSKTEGRTRDLADVVPDPAAFPLAEATGKPPSLVDLVLNESTAVLRAVPGVLITRHHTGHVLANAGIDASNVGGGDGSTVLLWPVDPDASATVLRHALIASTGVRVAVIVADSLGRAWRQGTLGTAIGVAGLRPTDDRRGERDLFGRPLKATLVAVADSVAAAAVLAMGEGAEGTPAAIVRGVRYAVPEPGEPAGARAILRSAAEDLFG